MKKIFFIFALALCAQLISAASDSYYFQRAEEAYNKVDYETCLHYCKEGVKKNPKDGKCWAVIAEICSKRAFARYGEALQASEKALAVLPKKDIKWRSFVHGIRGKASREDAAFVRRLCAEWGVPLKISVVLSWLA